MSLMLVSLGTIKTHAQVGMPTNNPNKNSVLDLNKTDGTNDKGLLLPKVALTGANNASPLSTHVAGMYVYNTATVGTAGNAVSPGEYYNDGTKWLRMPTSPWNITGNAGNTTSNFLGTTDAVDLAFKTNNTEQVRITKTGNMLVGTNTIPTGGTNAKLIVNNNTTAGALQIVDGSQANGKVLTSDVNGVASWEPPVSENTKILTMGSGTYLPSSSANTSVWYYTGNSISLPPGKWLISADILLIKDTGPTAVNETWWVRSTFMDTPNPAVGTLHSTDITSTSYFISGLLPGSSQFAMIKGNVVITNSSTTNKTYYYVAGSFDSINTTGGGVWIGDGNVSENKITYQRIY